MPDTIQTKTIDESQYPTANAGTIERRILSVDNIEMRVTDDDKPRITGYAAKFGIFTDLGWFREKIKKGAFDEALKTSDVRCLKNHDPNLILGRTTSETLRLESNSVGLKFDNDMPDTTTGKDTREEIRRGDISGCSFSFTVEEEDWKHFKDKPSDRTIVKVGRLFDVGPVTYPAYPDTTVAARSLEENKKQNTENGDQNPEELRAKKYNCECIECGHTLKTDKHCKDIKCSECGGKMRRKERPGPGQKSQDTEGNEDRADDNVPAPVETVEAEETEESKKIKRDRQLDIQRKRRELDCIHKRVTDQINEIEKD